jgi:hypothetical protein
MSIRPLFTMAGLILGCSSELVLAANTMWARSSLLQWKQRPAGVVKKHGDNSSDVRSATLMKCGMDGGHSFFSQTNSRTQFGPAAGTHSIGEN